MRVPKNGKKYNHSCGKKTLWQRNPSSFENIFQLKKEERKKRKKREKRGKKGERRKGGKIGAGDNSLKYFYAPVMIVFEGVFSVMVVMHINFSNLKNKWIDKVLKFNRISECKPETIHIMDV